MKDIKRPMVSAVMAVYNGQNYINAAIDSILKQSIKDFELVIVNDGSTDDTESIVKSYRDSRIVYIKQENSGLAAALNKGIAKSRGEYIARMDADDISYPHRFKLQLNFLERHKDIALVGTNYDIIDMNNKKVDRSYHLDKPNDLYLEFLVRNPFGHGTIMVRREALDKVKGYDEDQQIEDYDLWWRIAREFKVANLPEVLYAWRVVDSGISHGSSNKRQLPISELMDRIWRQHKILLPTNTELKRSSRHYRKLGKAYYEQYVYMICAVYIALARKRHFLQKASFYFGVVRHLKATVILHDLKQNPRSHNYNLSNISK